MVVENGWLEGQEAFGLRLRIVKPVYLLQTTKRHNF